VLFLILLIGIPALAGAALCRTTRLHPLVAGLMIGIVGAALSTMVLAGIVGTNAFAVGPIVGLFPAAAAALGGFLGWLRRKHVERIGS
jgi:hypothetical protein